MFTSQSVAQEKTSNMQSQDELYSFLGDRVRGFHSSVVRRGSEGYGWAVVFFFNKRFLTRQVNAQFHSHFKITKISFYERFVKIKQCYSINM